MAITLRNAGTWAVITGASAVTLPTHEAGDMLIVRVTCKSSNVAANVITCDTTGWTKLGQGNNGTTNSGNGTGSIQVAVFYKIAESNSETNPTVAAGADFAPGAVVAMVYQKASSDMWAAPMGNSGPDTTSNTSHSATIASHIRVYTDDVVDVFTGIADDTTMTVPTVTQAGVTFNAVTESPAAALISTTGNDISADGAYRTATAGTSTAAAVVTGTLSTAETGTSWMTRLRVMTPPPTGQAQAKLKGIGQGFAQAQAKILAPSRVHAQANAAIGQYTNVVDTFTRSVTDGLGTADVGGAYTLTSGTGSQADVNGSKYVITYTASTGPRFTLTKVYTGTSNAHEIKATFKITNFGNGTGSSRLRIMSEKANIGDNGLGASIDVNNSTGAAIITTYIGPNSSTTGTLGTYALNETWNLKARVARINTSVRVQAKIWRDGDTEPGWQITADNTTTPFFSTPQIDTNSGNSTVRQEVDDLYITPIGWSESGQAQALIVGKQPIHICGAECGIIDAGATPTNGNARHWDFGQGVTVSNTVFASGQRSYKIQPTGSATYLRKAFTTTSTVQVGQVKIYVEAWPTATSNVVYANVAAGAAAAIQVDASTHELEVQIGGDVNAVSRPGAISLNTWYTIDYYFYCGASGFARMRVDGEGTTYESTTGQAATTFSTGQRIGTAAGDATFILYVDDIIMSETGSDFPFAAQNVGYIYPNSSGTHSFNAGDFKDTGGTDITSPSGTVHTLIDDASVGTTTGQDDITDYIQQAAINTSGYVAFGFSNIVSGATPYYAAVVSSHHASTTGANTSTLKWWDGSTETAIYTDADFSQLTRTDDSRVYTSHPTQGNWSETTLNAVEMRWGYSSDVLGIPYLDGVIIEYSYTGGSVTTVAYGLGQAQASIKNTYYGLGQSQARIKQTYYGLGQSQARIKQTYFALGQAQAQIKNTYFGLGQAQAQIKQTYYGLGQAQADVKQTYYGLGQAQARIKNSYYGLGQSQAQIKQVYYALGQAQARIKNTYRGFGQAQASIKNTYRAFGQSQARIKNTYYGLGQAQAIIAYRRFYDTFTRTEATLSVADDGGAYAGSTIPADGDNAVFAVNTGTQSAAVLQQVRVGATGVHFKLVGQFDTLPSSDNIVFVVSLKEGNTLKSHLTLLLHSSGLFEVYINGYQRYTSIISLGVPFTVEGWNQLSPDPSYEQIIFEGFSTRTDQLIVSPVYAPNGAPNKVEFALTNFADTTYSGFTLDEILVENWNQYTSSGQAQALIFNPTKNAHGQAQGTINTTSYASSNAQARINAGGALTYFRDTFTRTLSNTIGSPDIGSYYEIGSDDANFEIDGSEFILYSREPANYSYIDIGFSTKTLNQEYYVDFMVPTPTGNLGYVEVSLVHRDTNYIRAGVYIDDIGPITWNVFINTLNLPVTINLDTWYRLRFAVEGENGRVKVWERNTPEPDWQLTSLDFGFDTSGAPAIYIEIDSDDDTDSVHLDNFITTEVLNLGAGQAQARIKNTYSAVGQAQAYITAIGLYAHGQAQALIKNVYYGSGQVQGSIKQSYTSVGQSASWIKNTYYGSGQSQARILQVYNAVAQAQGRIKQTYYGLGQAQAKINAFGINVHGQAQATIKNVYYAVAQANAWIEQTSNAVAQAQARIKNIYYGSGQAQADIKQSYTAVAQTQAWIENTYSNTGQAQASIKQVYYGLGQAQGTILTHYYGSGQANADIKATSNGSGQAQGDIKQTYNAVAQAQAAIVNTYYGSGQANAWIEQTYYGLGQTQGTVKTSYTQTGQAQSTILQVYYGSGQSAAWIKNTYFAVAQAQARILQSYTQVAQAQAKINAYGVNAHGQAQGNIRFMGNAIHAQAQAKINAYGYPQHGQAQGSVKQTYYAVGQAQGTILRTYYGLGQSQAWIENTYFGLGQANADILATSYAVAQANAYIIRVNQNVHGQAQAVILNTYFGFGQANAKINAFGVNAHGQANAYILSGKTAVGQAQGTIKAVGYGLGQSQADIKTTYNATGQAQGDIKTTYYGSGQANALIVRSAFATGQAQGEIKQSYIAVGQAQGTIKTSYTAVGQAQAEIKQTYYGSGQANAYISTSLEASGQAQAEVKQTYRAYGQARAWIEITSNASGQASALVKNTYFGSGQANAYILLIRYGSGQAEATIKSTSSRIGQAQASILQSYYAVGNAQSLVRTTVNSSGQAQARVKTVSTVVGQAQGAITTGTMGHGQAQAFIHRSEAMGQAQGFVATVHTLLNVEIYDDRVTLVSVDDELISGNIDLDDDIVPIEITIADTKISILLIDEKVVRILVNDEAFGVS